MAAQHGRELSASSHQGYQLLRSGVNVGVDDGHVELRLGGQLLARGRPAGAPAPPSVSVPRPTRRRTSSSQDGGARNTNSASGIVARTWRAPCRSISSSAGRPAASASLDRRARRAVAGAPVHDGPLEQLAVGDHRVELARRRRTGSARRRPRPGAADGSSPTPRSRPRGGARACRPPTVPLPTAGRAGEDRQPRAPSASVDVGQLSRAAELALERGDLVGAQAAHPAGLGDAEPLHHLLRADLADPGHRLQQVDDPHLADDLVVLALAGARR